MRALVLFLFVALPTAAFAQSDDFNPFQATLERMPLAEAQPAIEAAYGPIVDPDPALANPYGKSTLVLTVHTSPTWSKFLFCGNRMRGFWGPVTPTQASEIINAQGGPDKTPPEIYGMSNSLHISLLDRTLSIAYLGVGTPLSRVEVIYPRDLPFVDEFCATLAD